MKNSIYVKSIIFFLIIFFVSNSMMVLILIFSASSADDINNENYLTMSSDIVIRLYELNIDKETIINTASSDRISLDFHQDLSSAKDAHKGVIKDSHIEQLNKDGKVFITKGEGYMIFYAGQEICVIKAAESSGVFSMRMAIIISIIITVSVAVLIIFMGIGSIMKPVIKMSTAARKVAQGDYGVRLEERKNKDALGQLIDDFNYMCKKLSETELMRKDFVSSISHEFKTPIQTVHGYARLIKEETGNKEHKEYLDRIILETERLSTLSANILTINGLNQMIDLGELQCFSFDEQIRQCILILESKWSKKNIQLNIELDKTIILAKQDMIVQVVINILDNAIKFTPDGGRIDISLKKSEEFAVFSVSDSGRGIDPEEKDKIFEKFYKCDPSRNTSGNGLGLSIVKKILDLHGFNIEVSDNIKGGAIFTVYLKLCPKGQANN
ncbi:MAG: ATP-binding protein [Christensenellales bacterium]|jgi:signal transduction histidine kinase